jgi:hypothetical protein
MTERPSDARLSNAFSDNQIDMGGANYLTFS